MRWRMKHPARIYSPNYALEQQVAAANDLHLFYGIDPFQLRGIVEAIAQGSGVPVEAYSVVLPPLDLQEDGDLQTANQDAVPDTQVLAEWAVSHVDHNLSYRELRLAGTAQQVGRGLTSTPIWTTRVRRLKAGRSTGPNLPDPARWRR